MDPHAENYFSWSPYAYCANNPLRIIDPDGKDWFVNNENGNLYYLKGVQDISNVSESLAEQLNIKLDNISIYENLGADNMFGDVVSFSGNKNLLDAPGVFFNASSAEKFMGNHGYEAVTRVDVKESKYTDYAGKESQNGKIGKTTKYETSVSNERKTYVASNKANKIEGNSTYNRYGSQMSLFMTEVHQYTFVMTPGYDLTNSSAFSERREDHIAKQQLKKAAKRAWNKVFK